MNSKSTWDGYDLGSVPIPKAKRRPVASVNIIVSYLRPFNVIMAPESGTKRFKWTINLIEQLDAAAVHDADPSLLYICSSDDAEQLLENNPLAFALVLTRGSITPDWAAKFRNRLILVQTDDRYSYMVALIQNLFTSLFVWQHELDRIVGESGDMTELLDAITFMTNNFSVVTDSSYNVIARTSTIEPADPVLRKLVEEGRYSAEGIERMETVVLPQAKGRNETITDDPWEGCPRTVFHMPIHINGRYFFHLSMACGSGMRPEGMKDFFEMGAERVIALCNRLWDHKMQIESPWHKVLTDLISDPTISESKIEAQLEKTEIPNAQQFKLLYLEMSDKEAPTVRNKVSETARALNNGNCYPFALNNNLLVLCYSTAAEDSCFSTRETLRDTTETIYEPFGVRTFASRVFTDIREIRQAYLQTLFTHKIAPVLEAERELAGINANRACYTFEHALPYYLLTNCGAGKGFMDFCLGHNFLEKIAAEDSSSGSNIIRLLWTYICFDCNATAVAKQLHMHRNTILYHIDKLEKRFDFDFSDPMNRNKLIMDFQIYFLTAGFTKPVEFADASTALDGKETSAF